MSFIRVSWDTPEFASILLNVWRREWKVFAWNFRFPFPSTRSVSIPAVAIRRVNAPLSPDLPEVDLPASEGDINDSFLFWVSNDLK